MIFPSFSDSEISFSLFVIRTSLILSFICEEGWYCPSFSALFKRSQFAKLSFWALERESFDIRVENTRLKEENEILREKMDALLTYIKEHKQEDA